jgi:hypothetical protein
MSAVIFPLCGMPAGNAPTGCAGAGASGKLKVAGEHLVKVNG